MRSLPKSIGLFALVAATGLISVVACSSTSGDGGVAGGGGSTASGGSGNGGAGGTSGFSFGGSGGSLVIDSGSGGGGGGLSPDASCGSVTQDATKIPLAMYIMLDQSGSMDDGVKWPAAVNGLQTFVNDPNSAGIKVALQLFPNGSGQCDGTGYDTPLVPMGVLPANGPNITGAMPGSANGANTPTEGALRGLIKYTKNYATQNPKEKVIGLFVTDGQPNGCDENQATLAGIVGAGFSQAPSILTFTMGMSGADFGFLDALAQAGGTGKTFNLSSGGAQAFSNALQAIAGTALGCDYDVPVSDAGKIDYSKVLVQYTNGGGQTSDLPKVDGPSNCGAGGGFYYDDPINPTKITLCPTTCTAVQADQQGKVQVLLGCALGPLT